MEITQSHLPFTPWSDPALSRLPGVRPVEGSWIVVDDAYAAQMVERARLLGEERDSVLQTTPGSEDAQQEALEVVLTALPDGFRRDGLTVTRPDGVGVSLDGAPLEVVARLIQEDILILQRTDGAEHVLSAGLLCFPASWTLAEKMGKPLMRIHAPVAEYDDDMGHRVQRLFDRVRPGRAMWRANALGYHDAALYQPRSEAAPRDKVRPARFLRSERQSILRLPHTGAVLFAVHTYVVPLDRLTPAQRAGWQGA